MPTRKISQKLHENSTCLPQSKFSLFWTSHTIHLGVQKNWWFLPSPPSSNNNIITSIDLSLFQFSGAYYRIRWLLNIKLWMSKEKLFHTHTIRQSNKFATSEKHLSSFFFWKTDPWCVFWQELILPQHQKRSRRNELVTVNVNGGYCYSCLLFMKSPIKMMFTTDDKNIQEWHNFYNVRINSSSQRATTQIWFTY